MEEMALLKLILGICLLIAGGLVFSIWREKLRKLKDDERTRFLMYNIGGGSWLIAVFSFCGGVYLLVSPLL